MSDLKHTVKNNVPGFVRQEHPLFVKFLEAYYEWLETPGTPYHDIRNHLDYLDFETSVRDFSSVLRNEYMPLIPEKLLVDNKLLVQHSREFLQSVGTERAFKFLFNVVYETDVEVCYPRDDLLRSSDGKWIDGQSVMYITDRGHGEDYLYKQIKQDSTGAIAGISRVIRRYPSDMKVFELNIENIKGTFDINSPVYIVDGKEEYIFPIGGDINISNPGNGFIVNNPLYLNILPTFDITVVANDNGTVDGKYATTIDKSELQVSIDNVIFTDFEYDGLNVTHPNIVVGSDVVIGYPSYKGYITVGAIDENNGVYSIDVVDMPFGIVEPTTISEYQDTGVGIEATIEPSVIRAIPGSFLNTDGFLSNKNVLTDSYKHQDFSYILKTDIQITEFEELILKLVHPAGMNMFGQVNILNLIDLMIRDHSLDITKPPSPIHEDILETSLYNQNVYLEDFKFKFYKFEDQISHFFHLNMSDVWNKPLSELNRHWFNINPTLDLPYIDYYDYWEEGYMQDYGLTPFEFIEEGYVEDTYMAIYE